MPAKTQYVVETRHLFQTRKKEHMDKVRLTNEDLHTGNTLLAEKQIGKEDGVLARHTMECQSGVDRGNAEIVAREGGLKQRKVMKGIESLRQRKGTVFLPHIQCSGSHKESYIQRISAFHLEALGMLV